MKANTAKKKNTPGPIRIPFSVRVVDDWYTVRLLEGRLFFNGRPRKAIIDHGPKTFDLAVDGLPLEEIVQTVAFALNLAFEHFLSEHYPTGEEQTARR